MELFHACPLLICERFCRKQRPCVEHRHVAQTGSSFLAKTLFHVPAELQHGACAALEAHRGQQRRAVCKQAGGCGGLVFLRECFVSLFEDDRVTDEDSRKQQKQQRGNEDGPERGLMEKSGALSAVRGVVFRIVRFRVVLFQLLALRYAVPSLPAPTGLMPLSVCSAERSSRPGVSASGSQPTPS